MTDDAVQGDAGPGGRDGHGNIQTISEREDSKIIVAEWAKSKRESFRLSLGEYHGAHVVDLRVWFTADDGTQRPSTRGLTCGVKNLPALADGFAKAVGKARARGLIAADADEIRR
jgi:hypothetical protein